MITQWISLSEIYAKCESDINFPTSYKNVVKNWIGECTETMKISSVLGIYHETLSVKNNQLQLPLGTQTVLAVYHKNLRLHFSNSIIGAKTFNDIHITPREMTVWRTALPTPELIKESDNSLPLPFWTQALQTLESYVISFQEFSDEFYTQNGNYLQFTFEEGEIDIFYHGVLKDKFGEILVPDNIFYTEAVINWVDYKLRKKGVVSGNPMESFEMYSKFRTQAIQNISYPSPEKIENMIDKMGMVSYDFYDRGDL